jgi:energy-coupling factor transport system substrate-specific component
VTVDPAAGADPAATTVADAAGDPAMGPSAPAHAAAPSREGPPPTALVVALVPLAVAVNFLANYLVALLGLPIYLDTIGTFLAAALLGPWWGALAGVMTNVVGALPNGASNLLFAPVNVAAALVWGYGIRRLLLGRTVAGFFGLAVVVGVVTGVLATPIVLFVFGGATGHPSDLITATLASFGIERAALVSSVITSVPDKVIAAYAGLAVTAALPAAVAGRAVLPETPGTRRLGVALAGIVAGIALAAIAVLALPPA